MELLKRKKKAKLQAKKQTPKEGTGLASFWLITFVGIALMMGVGAGALLYLSQEREGVLERQRLDLQVQHLRQRLSHTLGLYSHLLQGLGSDPDLVQLFRSGDRKALKARETVLAKLLPDVLRVRLLMPGHDEADLESEPPLSFASLALLRAAESVAEPPPMELIQAKTPTAHLVGVVTVRESSGATVGLVHAAFDPAPLRRWVKGFTTAAGRIELQQQVEGINVTLYATPGAQEASGGPAGVRWIPGSPLALAYWYRSGVSVAQSILIGIGVILGVLVLLSGLLITLQYKRMRQALEVDQASMIGLADDAVAGNGFRRVKPQLQESGSTLELLTQRLKEVSEGASAAAPAAKKGGGGSNGALGVAATVVHSLEEGEEDMATEDFLLAEETKPSDLAVTQLPEMIFRAYDIRGVVGDTLTTETVMEIGRAVGSQAYDQGQQSVIVARDARASGKELAEALIGGLNATGRDVIDLGIVPVPVLYFATHFLGSDCGVMVTGSHSPPQWNGLKVIIGGESLSGDALLGLRDRVEHGDLLEGSGDVNGQELVPDYIERIIADVSIARTLKVVIDCAGGCASLVAPQLFGALGCEVVELSCELGAGDSETVSNPPVNLDALQKAVVEHKADIGLAFGDDGGRLGVVDSAGRVIWPDRLLMLLSADVLSRHPGGDVVFDVMCSRALASQILQNGGRPVMWKSGHSPLKAKLRETGALLAGEWSGHIMFRERWYGFDDAMYAGARLLEILGLDPRSSEDLFSELPDYASTPELLLPVGESEQYDVMDRAQKRVGLLGGAKLTTIDGLRAEFEEGWGLIRASNTESALCFRFEADSEQALERIQGLYRTLLADVAPELKPPF